MGGVWGQDCGAAGHQRRRSSQLQYQGGQRLVCPATVSGGPTVSVSGYSIRGANGYCVQLQYQGANG